MAVAPDRFQHPVVVRRYQGPSPELLGIRWTGERLNRWVGDVREDDIAARRRAGDLEEADDAGRRVIDRGHVLRVRGRQRVSGPDREKARGRRRSHGVDRCRAGYDLRLLDHQGLDALEEA